MARTCLSALLSNPYRAPVRTQIARGAHFLQAFPPVRGTGFHFVPRLVFYGFDFQVFEEFQVLPGEQAGEGFFGGS